DRAGQRVRQVHRHHRGPAGRGADREYPVEGAQPPLDLRELALGDTLATVDGDRQPQPGPPVTDVDVRATHLGIAGQDVEHTADREVGRGLDGGVRPYR